MNPYIEKTLTPITTFMLSALAAPFFQRYKHAQEVLTEREKLKIDVIKFLAQGNSTLKHAATLNLLDKPERDEAHKRLIGLIDAFTIQEHLMLYQVEYFFGHGIYERLDSLTDLFRDQHEALMKMRPEDKPLEALKGYFAASTAPTDALVAAIEREIDLSWWVIFKHVFAGSKLQTHVQKEAAS